MVLAIKFRDSIFVPQTIIDSGKYLLGLNYTLAQNQIKGLYNTNDEALFNSSFTQILNLFKPELIFTLYHLVDSLSISELLIANDLYNKNLIAITPNPTSEMLRPIENYLNYFGFEIKKRPTNNQLDILIALKNTNIISEFWLEGDTRQIKSSQDVIKSNVFDDDISVGIGLGFVQNQLNLNIPDIQSIGSGPIPSTNSLDNLNYRNLENRGAGGTIIIIEADATNILSRIGKKVNISNFQNNPASFDSFGELGEGNLHQLQTLSTLYGDKDGQVEGLIPKANLVVCSLQNIEINRGDFEGAFPKVKNNILSLLRKNLFETHRQNRKNSTLLLEFETWIPINRNKPNEGEYYPSYIIYDIAKRFKEISTEQNIIVVGGVGNTEKNFNNLSPIPWTLRGYTYVNLVQKDLPFIMVGATEKKPNDENFTIANETNFGKELDIYMYTNFGLGINGLFPGTSGASAATAGIITYLQGKALLGNISDSPSPNQPVRRKLTLQNIKNVFSNTFMKTFPRDSRIKLTQKTTGIIHHTILNDLWVECQKELGILQRQ